MIMRKKNRYILIRSTVPMDMNDKNVQHEFSDAILKIMGIHDYSAANPRIMKSLVGNMFIVRVSRSMERKYILASAFAKKIGTQNIGFQTIKISGSISTLINYKIS